MLAECARRAHPRVHLYLPGVGKPRRVTSREQLESFLGRADLGIDEVGVDIPLAPSPLRVPAMAGMGGD